MNSPYWFELAVVFGLVGLGNIVLPAFAVKEPKWRRVAKMILGGAISVLVSATAGRAWFFVLVGVGANTTPPTNPTSAACARDDSA